MDKDETGWTRLHYKIFGHYIRSKACMYAAIAMAGRAPDETAAPMVWSLAVFFERYMHSGAEGTRAEFGPKEPIELKSVGEEQS